MKCPKCGKEIANDSLFCEHCGTKTINGEQQTKRVDIRWCLLPSMIIATIAMGFAAESWDIYLFHGQDHNVIPFFVVPSSIFVASCFYGIKKLVPASFVILIVMLFSINCKMLYDSVYTWDSYRFEVDLTWHDEDDFYSGNYGVISLSTGSYRKINNEEKVKNDLLECARALEGKLKVDGKPIDCKDEHSIYRKTEYYTGWKGYRAFFYLSIVLVVYLIYAILAHKKGWRF